MYPGWLSRSALTAWFGTPPADTPDGWGLAYRRNARTGVVVTEIWRWAGNPTDAGVERVRVFRLPEEFPRG